MTGPSWPDSEYSEYKEGAEEREAEERPQPFGASHHRITAGHRARSSPVFVRAN